MSQRILKPAGWRRPAGYAHGIVARGRMVVTAGLIGWNEHEEFESKNFLEQFRQVLINTKTVLAEAGAAPADIVRMTCYITDKQEYASSLEEIGEIWREILGKVYPCMAVVEVVALVEDDAKVEIETTAIIDDAN